MRFASSIGKSGSLSERVSICADERPISDPASPLAAANRRSLCSSRGCLRTHASASLLRRGRRPIKRIVLPTIDFKEDLSTYFPPLRKRRTPFPRRRNGLVIRQERLLITEVNTVSICCALASACWARLSKRR